MEVLLTLLSSQQAPAFLALLSQKLGEQSAISQPVCIHLSHTAQISIALLPRNEKEKEWGQRRDMKTGASTEEDERGERSEARTSQQGGSNFVWDTIVQRLAQ